MCLAIPGKVIRWQEKTPPFAQATVEFGGVRRQVSMDFVPDAAVGDYVLIHAGIALSRVDQQEAARTLELLSEIEIAEEIEPNAAQKTVVEVRRQQQRKQQKDQQPAPAAPRVADESENETADTEAAP